jgi:uncharacterized membrane protein YeaQ/YmgE (transglycosylase-associated protein family)
MILADIPSLNFIPSSGILDSIFHQTWLAVSVLGQPAGGYKINLIQLIIILIIAVTVNAIVERLTSKKVGGLFAGVVLTVIGSYLFSTYVLLPFDFRLEGLRIIAALLGALVIGVFYNLIRAQLKGGK